MTTMPTRDLIEQWIEGHDAERERGALSWAGASRTDAVEPRRNGALSLEQVKLLLAETQYSRYPVRDYAILQLLLQTGMRLSECSALCWEDVSLAEEQGVLVVGEGRARRQVPLNRAARQALADYLAQRLGVKATLYTVAEAWPLVRASDRRCPLWRSQKGTLAQVSMSRVVKQLIRSCAGRGLVWAGTTAYSLRFTFASRYLGAHPNDFAGLAQLLGIPAFQGVGPVSRRSEHELFERVEAIDLNVGVRRKA
jgi:integrase